MVVSSSSWSSGIKKPAAGATGSRVSVSGFVARVERAQRTAASPARTPAKPGAVLRRPFPGFARAVARSRCCARGPLNPGYDIARNKKARGGATGSRNLSLLFSQILMTRLRCKRCFLAGAAVSILARGMKLCRPHLPRRRVICMCPTVHLKDGCRVEPVRRTRSRRRKNSKNTRENQGSRRKNSNDFSVPIEGTSFLYQNVMCVFIR
jgi:hypothetical protein